MAQKMRTAVYVMLLGVLSTVIYFFWAIQISRSASNSSMSSRGDEECERFRQVFANNRWSADKPLAAVYYLVTSSRLTNLNVSLRLLEDNFIRHFRYPVILFYEDTDAHFDVGLVRSFVVSSELLFFQKVKFELPSFVDRSKVPKYGCLPGRFPIGYRHMCRFQARTVYDEPIMDGLEYALRLDDDSHILRPITYDVFHFMRSKKIQYGYVEITEEWILQCIAGLWESADNYVKAEKLATTNGFGSFPRHKMYYNNFEISALDLWRSASYQKYIDYIDRLGGIYYYRWGDAPIKTIAVSLFVPSPYLHHFTDIKYEHQYISKLK